MQVNIVRGGEETRLANMYIRPTQNALEFMQQSYQAIPQMLGNAGRALFETVQQTLKPLDYDLLARVGRSMLRQVQNMWTVDEIQPLTNIGMFQNPPSTMRRWIMAEPTVRRMYHTDMVEGYGSDYIDTEPGKVGVQHSDYRIVMNGVVTEDDIGNDTYTNYYFGDVEQEAISEMACHERADILTSWTRLRRILSEGLDDPTSKWNAAL